MEYHELESGMPLADFACPTPVALTPRRFGDERGFFSETWNRRRSADLGIDVDFVQDNQSLSRDVGVVRGLHCQAPPHEQGKLVRVIRGAVLDVAVDVRRGSPSYGRWSAIILSEENGTQFYLPPGYLHGFVTRAPETEVLYKCTDYYAPECERAVRYDDPGLGIDWGLGSRDAILSDKDRQAGTFKEFTSPFIYERITT